MKRYLRVELRKIILEDFGEIDLDSYDYFEFENIIIENIYSGGFLEEGFNFEKFRHQVVEIIENLKIKNIRY